MTMIAPSVLSADFARLGEEVEEVRLGGADWLHVDVMDGRFVPNISLGLPVAESLRRVTELPLDVHLMILEPERYAGRFCDAGADLVTFHVEADTPEGISRAIRAVKDKGKRVGLALRPGTAAEAVLPWLEELDLVLVMTVEPGFGGQRFMENMLPKIEKFRRWIGEKSLPCLLEADGGVDEITAARVKAAGADVLVAGSAVFGRRDRAAAIRSIREG